jgi:hypothetical protein
MRLMRWAVVPVCVVLAVPAWGARLEVRTSTRELEVGQAVSLELRIVDAVPTSVPRMEAPDGLRIDYAGSSRSTKRMNQHVTRVTSYNYRLFGVAEGTWTVGPFDFDVGGEKLTHAAVEFVVAPRSTDATEPFQAFASFDRAEAWTGQVLVYHYGFRSMAEPLRSNWTLPPLDGLHAPRDATRPRKEYAIDDPAGRIYMDETWLPFVVTAPGERAITGAVVNAVVRDVSSKPRRRRGLWPMTPTKTVVRATESAALTVRERPPAPPEFSGLVGDFTLTSMLDVTQAKVGESVPWVVAIRGDGTLEGLKLDMPDVANARVYDSTPRTAAQVSVGKYEASGVYERVVVPTEVGVLQLPPLQLVAFSPTEGRYVTHTSRVDPIVVSPGVEGSADVSSFARAVGSLTEQPYEGPRDIVRTGWAHRTLAGPALPMVAAAVSIPGVLVVLLELKTLLWAFVVSRRRERVPKPVDPLTRLQQMPDHREGRLAVIDGALREALARHAGVPVAQLDRGAVTAGLPEALAAEVADITLQLDRARFAEQADEGELVGRVRGAILAMREVST